MHGIFITIEGVEGSGKGIQAERLARYIEGLGYKALLVRDPGSTGIGERIREILLDPASCAMSPISEVLLYAAARAQLVDECIQPALDCGEVVISDRFADSTTAYQGVARGLHPELIAQLHGIATRGVWPALTIVLDIDPQIGLERVTKTRGYDRLEQESMEFHAMVRTGFLELANREPHRIKVVDAARSPDAIEADIRALVDPLLRQKDADTT